MVGVGAVAGVKDPGTEFRPSCESVDLMNLSDLSIEQIGTLFVPLATATVLYAMAWILTGWAKATAWRWLLRFGLLALFFIPAIWVAMHPSQQPPVRTSAPERRVITTAPPPPPAAPAPTSVPDRSAGSAPPPASPPPVAAAPPPAPPPPVAAAPPPGAPPEPSPRVAMSPPPVARSESAGIPRSAAPPPPPPVAAATPPPAPPAPDPRFDVVPVYYGTDRAQETRGNRIVYTETRANRLELGHAEITVPKSHQVPNVERPWAIRVPFTSITLYQQAEDPAKHFTIRKLESASQEQLLALVRARLQAARTFPDHATIFIHGYNTDFDFALYRTAQIAYDLKFDGAPFMYSWPAAGGVASYLYDRDSADIAEPHLRAFLEMVVSKSGAKNVSVIAHSMGNRPLLRVLRDIAPRLPEGVKLDQVILASPDVDTTLFMQLAASLPTVSRGVTLYASSNDRAMAASRLFGGATRAGDIPAEGPVIVPGVDTIDVSSVSLDVLAMNHSLFAERTSLVEDMARLIGSGVRPPDTRLPQLLRITTPRGDYWRFP